MLVAMNVYHNEGKERQYQRYGYVAREVGATGEDDNQSEQVHYQDKEEAGEQIGCKLVCFILQSVADYTSVDEINQKLEEAHTLAGCLEAILLVMAHQNATQQPNYECGYEQGANILCDGDVDGLVFAVICAFAVGFVIYITGHNHMFAVFNLFSLSKVFGLFEYRCFLVSVERENLHHFVLMLRGVGNEEHIFLVAFGDFMNHRHQFFSVRSLNLAVFVELRFLDYFHIGELRR